MSEVGFFDHEFQGKQWGKTFSPPTAIPIIQSAGLWSQFSEILNHGFLAAIDHRIPTLVLESLVAEKTQS